MPDYQLTAASVVVCICTVRHLSFCIDIIYVIRRFPSVYEHRTNAKASGLKWDNNWDYAIQTLVHTQQQQCHLKVFTSKVSEKVGYQQAYIDCTGVPYKKKKISLFFLDKFNMFP